VRKSIFRVTRKKDLKAGPVAATAIRRLILCQSGLTLILSASLLMLDRILALSVLLGGLVVILPGFAQAWYWLTREVGTRQLLLGEASKLGLSAVLFVLVYTQIHALNLAGFFTWLIVAQLMVIPVMAVHFKVSQTTDI